MQPTHRNTLVGAVLLVVAAFGVLVVVQSPRSERSDGVGVARGSKASSDLRVEFGLEFWRSSAKTVDDAIVRVRHAFRAESDEKRTVRTDTYALEAKDNELRFVPATASDAPLRWHAQGLVTDGQQESLSGGPTRTRGDTWQQPLATSRSRWVEHVRAAATGAEYTWILAEWPTEARSLTLLTSVDGYRASIDEDHEVRFRQNDSSQELRVGPATLVDANGVQTPIEASLVEGGLAFSLTASMVESAEFPIAIDPLVEVELPLDDPLTADISNQKGEPRIAHGDGQSLIVWAEQTTGNARIVGVRVADSGEVLDSPPRVFSQSPGATNRAAVASDGTSFLVAWQDFRNATSDIYGIRVGPDGESLDANDFPIASGSSEHNFPSLAFGHGRYLATWQDKRENAPRWGVSARSIDAEGAVDPAVISVRSTSADDYFHPHAAPGPNGFLITYGGDNKLAGKLLAANDSSLGAETVYSVVGGVKDYPYAAWSGAEYLVTWRQSSAFRYASRRATEDGSVISSAQEKSYNMDTFRGIASSRDDDWLVIWSKRGSGTKAIFRALYRRGDIQPGQSWDPPQVEIADQRTPDSWGPSVAPISEGYLIAWREGTFGAHRIRAQRLDLDAEEVGSEFTVALLENLESAPAIANNGDVTLVVWEDDRLGGADLFGARLARDGTLLDPDGLSIASGIALHTSPAVASDGSGFLVAYHQDDAGSTTLRAVTVGADGTINADVPGELAASSQRPAVAGGSLGYYVVWEAGSSIAGRSVSAAGVMGAVDTIAASGEAPRVAQNPDGHLVVYASAGAVRGIRIASGGSVLDPSPGITLAASDASKPDIASLGSEFLAVWEDASSPVVGVTGARVTWAGTVSDPAGLTIGQGASAKSRPRIAGRSGVYLVAWEDDRDAGSIYGSTVLPDGSVGPPGDFQLASSQPPSVRWPVLAPGPNDDFVLAYRQLDSSRSVATSQIRLRWISLDPDDDGVSAYQGDCNDDDASVFPGALESCDAVDSDCDGSLVDGFFDNDNDGTPDCIDTDDDDDGVLDVDDECQFVESVSCDEDTDGDGVPDGLETALARNDPNTAPGAVEICDGRDNDGDSLIDEGTGCNTCD